MDGLQGFEMPNIDFGGIQQQIRNSQAAMNNALAAQAEYIARKDAALFETAEASVAQKELLGEQLVAAKEQNQLLQMNYDTLKELYNNTKAEATENKVEAKRSRIFGWVTFGIGTLIGAAGLAVAIITLAVSR